MFSRPGVPGVRLISAPRLLRLASRLTRTRSLGNKWGVSSSSWGTPWSLDGFCKGKSDHNMDDFSGGCQNTMVDQNQRIWKEARVRMPRSLVAGSTMKQFPSQAEPNMVCLNDRKWGYNQHETNHFKGNDEDIQWQDSNSLFATNFFISGFTDHTLAHPLNCRGGVVAHLSA